MTRTDDSIEYDVFLSYSHFDAKVVEALAERLDDIDLNVWLDKWNCVPGEKWQQAVAKGLDRARSCAVCIGEQTSMGWFREEIERALNRQTMDESFRVMPVLLPNANASNVDDFLELRTWVDFRKGLQNQREFHVLVSGILGKPPGRGFQEYPKHDQKPLFLDVDSRLTQIQQLYIDGKIFKEIAMECQRELVKPIVKIIKR